MPARSLFFASYLLGKAHLGFISFNLLRQQLKPLSFRRAGLWLIVEERRDLAQGSFVVLSVTIWHRPRKS
jgi:hypothetical protein